jgi:antitoxin PrlF
MFNGDSKHQTVTSDSTVIQQRQTASGSRRAARTGIGGVTPKWATGVKPIRGGRREADAMARTTLRAKGQLTLPDDIRKAAKLEEGDLIEVVVIESGEVILRPLVAVDRSQAWFWTPEWQAGEREASAQALRGEGKTFKDDADFLDSLR